MSHSKWIVKPTVSEFWKEKFSNYSPFIQNILYQRGIKTKKEAEEFFELDYSLGNNDPFLLSEMKIAVARILKALQKKEKIAIYGDYDADGVTASSVVYQFFLALKIKPVVYLPDRLKDGYGLNKQAALYLQKKGINLVITVDTGVRNSKEVAYFKKIGLDVIITDHHSLPPKLPKAFAIINPHKDQGRYPTEYLSGAGVAFKLVQALIKTLGEKKFPIGFEKWLLDLVALGTVADLVPLFKENRVFTKYGLIVLNKTRRIGIQALMQEARLNPQTKLLKTEEIAFGLAPRINAAGRMNHANLAFHLLNSTNPKKANKLAKKIGSQNRQRQEQTAKIFQEVEKIDHQNKKLVFAGKKGWPIGLVGLAAGKLAEKFHRPTFIYSDEDTRIRGSARSIPNFNIIEALDSAKDLIQEYGGHKQAAGFTVLKKNLPAFQKKLENFATKKLQAKDLIPQLQIDYILTFDQINQKLMEELKALEPFGKENEEPVFLSKKVTICDLKAVGNGEKHLRFSFSQTKKGGGIKYFKGMGFYFEDFKGKFQRGDLVDIVYQLNVNFFQGRESLEFRLKDIKLANK